MDFANQQGREVVNQQQSIEAIHAANLALASAQLRIARIRKAAEQRAQKAAASRG